MHSPPLLNVLTPLEQQSSNSPSSSFHSIDTPTSTQSKRTATNSPNNQVAATWSNRETSELNRFVKFSLDRFDNRMTSPDKPSDNDDNGINDIDVSTYVSAKSPSSFNRHQPPLDTTNFFGSTFQSSFIIQDDQTKQRQLQCTTTDAAPVAAVVPPTNLSNNNLLSDIDFLLANFSSPSVSDVNHQSLSSSNSPHLLQDCSSSVDLLYFSDDDLEFLSKGPTSAAASEYHSSAHSPFLAQESNLTPPSEAIKPNSPQSNKNYESAAADHIDNIISFFDCSKPKFPASPASEAIKQACLTSSIVVRPAAAVPAKELEDPDKKSIYVIYEASCTPVSWCSDNSNKDVREMILCACDAIIDGGFVLREIDEILSPITNNDKHDDDDENKIWTTVVNGARLHYQKKRRFEFEQFHKLVNGGIYELEPATERHDLKRFIGDRWRRLKLVVEPLMHVESQKSLKVMKRGSNLLKHTNLGFPHLRQFQLSADCNRLLWYSTDMTEKTTINVPSIKEIRLGQKTPLFKKYKLPSLEHLSFSVIFDSSESFSPLAKGLAKVAPHLGLSQSFSSLDLTCKDEFEYDDWVTGLKALVCNAHHVLISKRDLLSHSRRFRRALEANNCGIKLSALPEIKDVGAIGLEECLELAVHSLEELEKKLERLQCVAVHSKEKVQEFDNRYNIDLSRAVELAAQFDDGFAAADSTISCGQLKSKDSFRTDDAAAANTPVFKDRSEADDDLLECVRMHELLTSVYNLLELASKDIIAQKVNDTSAEKFISPTDDANNKNTTSLKKINQLLWKAEVDLENVEDMHRRLTDRRMSPENPIDQFSRKIVEFNDTLNVEIQKISSTLNSLFSANPPSAIHPAYPVIATHHR